MAKCNYFNIPRYYDTDSYDKSIKRIVKKFSKIKDVVSIYDWGSPSSPGISDIDVLVVFKDKISKSLPLTHRSFMLFDAQTRYLIRHPFVFINESAFKRLGYIYDNRSFELLYGKEIGIAKIPKKDQLYIDVSILNDIIVRHYPRDFIFQSKGINVRDTLLRLNSIKYTVQILSKLTKKNKDWDEFVSKVRKLRDNWFINHNYKLLNELNQQAVPLTLEIVEVFSKFLMKKKLVKIEKADEIHFNAIKNKTLFIKNWKKEKALSEMKSLVKSKKYSSILPLELCGQLAEYSKGNGLISDQVRKNLVNIPKVKINKNLQRIIKNKIEILNSQAELASKLKHSDFAAFFDYGHRTKTGINNWVLNLLDNARF